jgi:hypothetical protein
MEGREYGVRGVSQPLDAALRAEAEPKGRSHDSLALDHLRGTTPSGSVHHDLDWCLGTGPAADGDGQAALVWLDAVPSQLA